ncbi:MAG: nuclear transport factor 2 family protein [Bacteriovoracaceae bacterium]|jgi:ketosteroid isomerase-like protein|nr:nuclear transport factor 2 family protein [Bacteriovoracaceae bacterium]
MSKPISAKELFKKYEQQLSFQSFEQMRDLISDKAIFYFNDGSFIGINEIEKAFDKTFELIKEETYWLTNVNWLHLDENSASCVYTFNWKGIVNNKEAQGSGRGTSIFAKENNNWKIIHEHLSRFPN